MLPVLLLLAACNPSPSAPTAPTPPAPAAIGEGTPVTVSVSAPDDEEVVVDTTLGDLAWLGVTSLDNDPMTVFVYNGGYVCPCEEAGSCPDAARPAPSAVTIPPGGRHDFTWVGLLLRQYPLAGGASCMVPVVPPHGRYRLEGCDRSGALCGAAEVELPLDLPVLLELRREAAPE